jgi:hypothetical protein
MRIGSLPILVWALLVACKNEKADDGWTESRRKYLTRLCEQSGRKPPTCTCVVNEVTTSATYREFIHSTQMTPLVFAFQVCDTSAGPAAAANAPSVQIDDQALRKALDEDPELMKLMDEAAKLVDAVDAGRRE